MKNALQKKRVVIIVGTRPQIIKSAPVLKAFKSKSEYECSVINTGQHYDYEMNKQFFMELDLPDPEIDLEVGQGSANEQIFKIMSSLDSHLSKNRPDLAIVPGDTNSALSAGIACSKLGIKIAHLEAGCRSNNFRMSEEINRRVLDHISDILLCPTPLSLKNVLAERVLAGVAENVGDTMFDSLLACTDSLEENGATSRLNLKRHSFVFMTVHRAENVDVERNLAAILKGIESFGIPVVFPAHPRTRSRLDKFESKLPGNMILIQPLPYLDTLRLVSDSKFVVTDSGGLQKECYWLGKRSLILRDTTEWTEIVTAGASILTGCDETKIHKGYLDIDNLKPKPNEELELFGEGKAAQKVVKVIQNYLGDS